MSWKCCCWKSDLLHLSGLEDHCVLEDNAPSAALEWHVVTNCINVQIHLPLWALHHRAGRLIGLCHLLKHIQEMSVSNCKIERLGFSIRSFTLAAAVLCFDAAEAGLEEFSHCSDFCLSLQSATSSTDCSNATSQSLQMTEWFFNFTGSLERNITFTSFEQPACRCPPCKDNPSDQKFCDILKRKDWLYTQKGLRSYS